MYIYKRGESSHKLYQIDDNICDTGDLLQIGSDIYLALGDQIYFYPHIYMPYKLTDISILCKTMFGTKTIDMIHHIVQTYYTSYRSAIALYISDIHYFVNKGFGAIAKYYDKKRPKHKNISIYIGPDIWTLYQRFANLLSSKNTILSPDSISRDYQHYIDISTRSIDAIYMTGSQIFQNWQNISQIIILEPWKSYYKAQRDPRYDIIELARYISRSYDCEVILDHK